MDSNHSRSSYVIEQIRRYKHWYAKLLRLYPKPYYERFGEGMEQTFSDVLRERLQKSVTAAALGMFAETTLGIIKENLKSNTMGTLAKRLGVWAVIVAAILMIPLLAHWPWTGGDFVFAVVVLFGSACVYEVISRKSGSSAYRWAVGVAVAASLVLVWINAAVGIIGNEERPANLLYFAVLLIGIVGAIIARFRARGMSRTMFVMAIAEALVPVVALIVWRPYVLGEGAGVAGVFILSWFFSALFVISGMLFQRANAALEKSNEQ